MDVQIAGKASPPRRSAIRYERRQPERSVLYAVLHEHLESLLALASDEHGVGLPRFVVRELRGFLDCGILAKGFARFRCEGCGLTRLVAFSCKGRGFCPSCGGKRMTQLAAHLCERVIPIVPTRQYVLSLPPQLRSRLAYDHAAQKHVTSVFAAALLQWYAGRAREHGIENGRSGAVTFVQRFGSALNLNLHLHTHALDGVFTEQAGGALRFHPLPPPSPAALMALLSAVRLRILRYAIERDLLGDDSVPELALDAPALAALVAASTQHARALGPRQGASVQRLLAFVPQPPKTRRKHPLSAHYDGFDMHAGLSIRARRRTVLERVLRYCARPALGHERLERLPDGRVRLALKTPWADGTTHMVFEPLEFIGRLTALVPRPHKNLLIYHGVLAPRSEWRSRAIAYGRTRASELPQASATQPNPHPSRRAHASHWATLMRRAFELDVLACPRCHARLRLVASITEPAIIRRILRHLGLPVDAPAPQPARAPPWAAPSDHFAGA